MPESTRKSNLALARLMKIVVLMQSGGKLTQADIALACGCSDRQVRRYLTALKDADICFTVDREYGYHLDADHSPFQLNLTLQETIALLLARQATVGREEMPFAASSNSAFEKIASLLPPNLREQLEDRSVSYHTGSRRDYTNAPWGALIKAIRTRQQLEMTYFTASRNSEGVRKVDPYNIVWLQDYCHLVGYCHTRKAVINFAMDNIRGVSPTGDRFEMQAGFSIRDYLKNAAGPMMGDPIEICVTFLPPAARYALKRTWPFIAETSIGPDGAVTLKATVRGLADIKRELLSWGRFAVVIAPLELRREMQEEAIALAALYDKSD